MGLDQFRVLGVVVLQQVDVLVAVAVGDEDDLLAVGRPGDAVVVGRVLGQPRRPCRPAIGMQEDLAVDDEGDVLLVRRQGVLGGALR